MRFWAEDLVVKTIDFEYGNSIPFEAIPALPGKDGYYGRWEYTELTNLVFDADIQAKYYPYITTLESEERRAGPLPVIVVEGQFTDENSLCLTPLEPESDEYEFQEAWQVTIQGDTLSTYVVRFIPPSEAKSTVIYLLEDGELVKADVKWDGKYILLGLDNDCLTFYVAEEGPSYTPYLISLGIGLAVGLFLGAKKLRKVAISTEMKHI